MHAHPWKRLAALLPLLALLAAVLPYRPAGVVAATASKTQTTVTDAVEDAQLVRAAVHRPIENAQFYFVMPDRFNNGDPGNDVGGYANDPLVSGFKPDRKGYYHGGDFKGLMTKLDYLDSMGINAIWMTPIFKNRPVQCGTEVTIAGCSAGYHGYWITDFTQVDPHLGTNAELAALIQAAHDRGIKVFFDIITNHTADVIDYAEGPANNYKYISKADRPYKDANGNAFNDRDYAGTGTFPPLDPKVSFPYTPVFPHPGDATIKHPDWLNNPIYYHNRGNSTFSGESAEYGDFSGLDDLFTEHPDVVKGMTDIYKTWISDFGIDGYRIDTVKHVNMEFWQQFAPGIMEYARTHGKPNFFMYGEVFSGDVPFVSQYTTTGDLPAALDFPFQGTARGFASQSQPTNNLRDLFAADDYYIDANSNAYQLPTFLGNHDIGRFGLFLKQDNASANDEELLARDRLGHALMYFSRGMPVVYYGDEQGFTGDGGDQDARQDMMPSQVASYNDDDLIGTSATTAQANFDTSHPLYQTLQTLAALRQANPALWRGAQIDRFSTDSAGIYAFSRIDRNERVEYIVALNNAKTEQSATFKTFNRNTTFSAVHPANNAPMTTDADGNITVTVPALSFVIYKAGQALPAMATAPGITMQAPTAEAAVTGRVEVSAQLDSSRFAEVTFAVKVGDGAYQVIGTDNNGIGPDNTVYRVFYDVSKVAPGTPLTFKAVVNDVTDDPANPDDGFGPLSSATANAVVAQEEACNSNPAYAIIHYQRSDGNYDGWGLHLWGDAIDPSEATEWTTPKVINGEDAYGAFWYIKLKDASQPLNFIIHKGDEKDPGPDMNFVPAESPEVWLKQGSATIYTSPVDAQGFVTIHYNRPAGNYDGWGLHLWGDAIDPSEATQWSAPKMPDGSDDYGVYFNVKIKDATQPLNYIVHKGDEKDTPNDRSFLPTDARTGDVWLKQGDASAYMTRAAAENVAIIHYHRDDGDYGDPNSADFNNFWGMHVWTGAANPTEWTAPLKPAGRDAFGIYFRVPLAPDATTLNYIIHRGDAKDLPEDQELNLTAFGNEVWILQSTPGYLLPLTATCVQHGDLSKAEAHWVSRDTIAWNVEGGQNNIYKLFYRPEGGLALGGNGITGGDFIILTYDPNGLSDAIKAKFPHLASFAALRISPQDQSKIRSILKGQFAMAAFDGAGNLIDATGIQIPGVLDDLYTYNGQLGVIFSSSEYGSGVPTLKLWAPTARSVKLHLFDSSSAPTGTVYNMVEDAASGVWTAIGTSGWKDKYYLYEVEVFVPETGKIEHNFVTDPYSISLSMNSTRSQIVNLNDPSLEPGGWNNLRKPELKAPEDIVLYETHVRDFSINDATVTPQNRGKFTAFTELDSAGMKHLRDLAKAGLTHIHLLPAFDCATINENPAERQEPDADVLRSLPPDSEQQQAIVGQFREKDGFNWCYDPYHYTTPEGSYSTNPDGPTRIREFREMVQALNQIGLRVVMDVVYNHTAASGQADKSVLDKIVPGYYHRLNLEGEVENSTCCANTATEHNMMEKLMVDSVKTWATAYKVDGFRFDLMGHHMKSNMIKVRDTLHGLTEAHDGVDGSKIYIYGEGWNFGEVANNQRGENATQLNLPGTGIGTFNDRLRDAVRGGSPFDTGENAKIQGFVNGLYYNPNDLGQGGPDEQKNRLLRYSDQIKVGLAGNLRDFTFTDRNGNTVKGSQVDYNGAPTGYTLDPQEVITYVEAHDNETLFDAIQVKAPASASLTDRVRMQNLGISIVSLAQGVPFFQLGQDMLRSKSGDRNSYDSGDWFNKLDWTYATNNWGVGLPPAWSSEANWPVLKPLLGNPALKPKQGNVMDAVDYFQEMLAIRKSSKLFRLETAQEIEQRVKFYNNGPNQIPGLIVESISDNVGADLDPSYQQVVVVFNANDEAQTFSDAAFIGAGLQLHPIQQASADAVVRTSSFNDATGAFTIPARTTAVFVVKQRGASGELSNRVFFPQVYVVQREEP